MLSLSQHLTLQQKLAPQLIQSLQLLQMPTLELELRIKQELERNPLLEESLDREEDPEEREERSEEGLKEEEELPQETEEVDWEARLEDQFDQGAYNSERTEYDPHWEVDHEPYENRITTIPPLSEQLQEQLALRDLSATEGRIGKFILGNIDERGYLTCTPLEMAEFLEIDEEEIEGVLAVIHTFDPPGIGARDLRECLMIQLQQQEGDAEECALQIVRHHLEDLTHKRFPRLTQGLGISSDELRAAMQCIKGLNPYPGNSSCSDYQGLLTLDMDVSTIVPDILVERSGDEWVVMLREGNLPALRLNTTYTPLLKEGWRNRKDEVQAYLIQKRQEARWLIHAIHQRRTTMLKVSRYLVQAQQPFFEAGPPHLRPMILQEVADAIDMHVSTISRVTNGKYMQTPHGVFELKYFFDTKIGTEDGEGVSARSVKQRIADLIGAEDPSRPLSDQDLAHLLAQEGLQIARRTVAKYRDQLGISSQRFRREW